MRSGQPVIGVIDEADLSLTIRRCAAYNYAAAEQILNTSISPVQLQVSDNHIVSLGLHGAAQVEMKQ